MQPWTAKVQGEFEVSMELPPSNSEINRSPSMLESDQSTAGSADVRRRKNWPLLLIFGFLGLLAGLLVGGIYFTKCTKVYQSQATITMMPRGGPFRLGSSEDGDGDFDIRHDQLIGEDTILAKCLIEYDLKDLPTLRDLSAVKQIEEIQKNLVVVQSREEPTKFELEYFSTDPRDAQTVLATIIKTYDKHLKDKYRSPTPSVMELLEKMRDGFDKEVKQVDKQLKMARDRVAKMEIGEIENVKSEALVKEIEELVLAKEKFMAKKEIAGQQIIEEGTTRSSRHKGFLFETTRSPCSGDQVRPALAVILPVFALTGAVVGLWLALLGVLVVGATR